MSINSAAGELVITTAVKSAKTVAPYVVTGGALLGAYVVSFATLGVVMSVGPRVMRATYNASEAVLNGTGDGILAIGDGISYVAGAAYDGVGSAASSVADYVGSWFTSSPAKMTEQDARDAIDQVESYLAGIDTAIENARGLELVAA